MLCTDQITEKKGFFHKTILLDRFSLHHVTLSIHLNKHELLKQIEREAVRWTPQKTSIHLKTLVFRKLLLITFLWLLLGNKVIKQTLTSISRKCWVNIRQNEAMIHCQTCSRATVLSTAGYKNRAWHLCCKSVHLHRLKKVSNDLWKHSLSPAWRALSNRTFYGWIVCHL